MNRRCVLRTKDGNISNSNFYLKLTLNQLIFIFFIFFVTNINKNLFLNKYTKWQSVFKFHFSIVKK